MADLGALGGGQVGGVEVVGVTDNDGGEACLAVLSGPFLDGEGSTVDLSGDDREVDVFVEEEHGLGLGLDEDMGGFVLVVMEDGLLGLR